MQEENRRTPYRAFRKQRNELLWKSPSIQAELDRQMKDYLSDDENLMSALVCEMADHECAWSENFEDAIEALGYDVETFLADERKSRIYKKAVKKFINYGTLFD